MYEGDEKPTVDWLCGTDVFDIDGSDIYTGMPYESAQLPQSKSDRPSPCAGPAVGIGGHEAQGDSSPAVPVGGQGEGWHEGAIPREIGEPNKIDLKQKIRELEEQLRKKQKTVDDLIAKMDEPNGDDMLPGDVPRADFIINQDKLS